MVAEPLGFYNFPSTIFRAGNSYAGYTVSHSAARSSRANNLQVYKYLALAQVHRGVNYAKSTAIIVTVRSTRHHQIVCQTHLC